MGIDAEDCGPGGHGPIGTYVDVVNNGILPSVTNGGNGILVIGSNGSGPTSFWNAIGSGTGEPVTYVTGAAISTQSFVGFKMIAVVGAAPQTCSGLTNADNNALAARQPDIADFVNGGGGLFGATQEGLTNPYAYMPDNTQFTSADVSYSDIDPTAAGLAIGVTDALDVCCWHNVYTAFPPYLTVLAFASGSTQAASVGGNLSVPGFVLSPATATNFVGQTHVVTATVSQTSNGTSMPLPGNLVNFTVTGVHPHTDMCTTDNAGVCTISYVGTTVGDDTITGTTVIAGQTRTVSVSKTWIGSTSSDLALSKSATPTSVFVGDNVTYALKLNNAGPSAADAVQVVDTLPAGTSFVSASSTQGSCANAPAGQVTCALGTVALGQVVDMTIVLKVNSVGSGSITNTAVASSTTTDPVPANNTASATVTVKKRPSKLVADPIIAKAYKVPSNPLIVQVNLQPKAHLTDSINGSPLAGRAINFTGPGKVPICSATTNASGVAECQKVLSLTLESALLGYNAEFTGDQNYLGSTAKGKSTIVVVNSLSLIMP